MIRRPPRPPLFPSPPLSRSRIYVFGHSNGGFMANRLGCDQADKLAAVVSLAGETYANQTKCAASAPVAYLQVQGEDRKSTRLNSSHLVISYAVFCLKKKNKH